MAPDTRLTDSPLTMPPTVPASAPRVVWVEDEPDLRFMFEQLMKLRNIPFCSASGALEGLKCYANALEARERPILILDIAMPEHSGLWLARKIRERGDWKTPIIFVTGFDLVSNKHGAQDVAAIGFLTKPVEPQQLWAMLDFAMQEQEQK